MTTERVVTLVNDDFEAAVRTWEVLHVVELVLGGGNEIAGGVWIFCISLVGRLFQTFGRVFIGLGLLTGFGGLQTIVPPLGDVAGMIFGLGAIAWFVAVGVALVLQRDAVKNPLCA